MIDIRRAGVEDVALLAPLFDAYRQFYHQAPDLALARRFLAERLGRGESVVYLAHTAGNGGIVGCGFTQLYPLFSSVACRPIWILYDLFVAPTCRRAGVARRLMEYRRDLESATTCSRCNGTFTGRKSCSGLS